MNQSLGLMFPSKNEEALCIYILLHDVLINVLSMLLLQTHTHIRKIYVYYVPTLGVVVPLGPYVERV